MLSSSKRIKTSSWWLASFCLWSCECVFCCETTAKWCYEILLFFRFTAWICFQFVKISKLLAKVTQNSKYRAVFLVMLPVNTRPKSALLDSQRLTPQKLLLSVRFVSLGKALVQQRLVSGICFIILQISILTYTPLLITQQWGLYARTGQEEHDMGTSVRGENTFYSFHCSCVRGIFRP